MSPTCSSGQLAMLAESSLTPNWPTASQTFLRIERSVSASMHASSSDLTICRACGDSLAREEDACPEASAAPGCIACLRSSRAHIDRTCGFWLVRRSCVMAVSRISGFSLAWFSACSAWFLMALSGLQSARIICSNWPMSAMVATVVATGLG